MRLVDVHCHLDMPEFDGDRERVIASARGKGVVAVVNSGLGVEGGRKALDLAGRFPGYVYATLGLEPSNLDGEEFEGVRRLILDNREGIVGVGEVGLDYYWTRGERDREIQRGRFRSFIRLAGDLGLPLVVHSRSAGRYALQVLEEEGAERVLMHAFDGRVGWAMEGVRLGYYFSIPTSVWHSHQKQRLARQLPLSCLMLESDSPVLSPVRGERNEPANLVYALRKVAELKETNEATVEEETLRNAASFFNLGEVSRP